MKQKRANKMRVIMVLALIVVMLFSMTVTVSAATFPNGFYSTSGSNLVALKIQLTPRSSEYLNVYSSSITDGKQVSTWNFTGHSTQKFIIYSGADGITTVRMHDDPMYALCKSGSNCVLRYIPNVTSINDIKISSIRSENYTSGGSTYYAWRLDVANGGCLTRTTSATPVSGGYYTGWQSFTSSNTRQIWHVDKW